VRLCEHQQGRLSSIEVVVVYKDLLHGLDVIVQLNTRGNWQMGCGPSAIAPKEANRSPQGFKASWLTTFIERNGGKGKFLSLSVQAVIERMIIPQSAHLGGTFCELLERQGKATEVLGTAKYLVSYSSKTNFLAIVDALASVFQSEKGAYIWMDCFCMSQHSMKDSLLGEKAKKHLSKMTAVLLVLGAPWDDATVFQSHRLLWEVHAANAARVAVQVCLPPAELDAVVADLEKKNAVRTKALFASISMSSDGEGDGEERATRAVTIKSVLESWLVAHLKAQASSTPNDELSSSRWMLLLGGFYFELGKLEQALPILEAAFGTRRRLVGAANDSATFAAMEKVAKMYDLRHEHSKALPLFKECLDKYAAVLGADHPTTLASHYSLASSFHHWNDYNNALELYQDLALKLARARQLDPYSTVLASLPDAAKLEATIALVKKLVSASASASTQRRRNSKTGIDAPASIGPMQRRGSKTGLQ